MAAKSSTANRANQFGTFAHDPNHQVMPAANYPLYQDATGTPNKSPLSITTTAVLLNIPAGAIEVTFIGTVAFRVGDQSGIATTLPYATIPANTPITLPVVTPTSDPNDTTGQMWVAADSTSGSLSFFFSCV